MDNIFQVPDSEFKTLQNKVKNQRSERSRSFNKPIKKQVALQKPLEESSEAMTLHCNNSLDGSYINRKVVNEAKVQYQLLKVIRRRLVVNDFNEKCNEHFRVIS